MAQPAAKTDPRAQEASQGLIRALARDGSDLADAAWGRAFSARSSARPGRRAAGGSSANLEAARS